MAQVLLQRELDERGIASSISSAGLTRDGMPAPEEVVELMAERGLDLSEHQSRLVTQEILTPVDLVVGMAREHVRETVLMQPALFARTFTLKELVWRGDKIGPRLSSESLSAWLGRMGIDRRPTDILGSSDGDDVEDPIGQRFAAYKKAADEIEDLVVDFVALAWPDGVDA